MYSKEKICTKKETKNTINSIEIEILSKIKPQLMIKRSNFIQVPKLI